MGNGRRSARPIAAMLLAVLCAMPLIVPTAQAAKRVALVIGNDTYDTLPALNNARADARGIADKLRDLGFDVILKLDAGRRSFGRAFAEFEGKAADAEVGLVFYAGHGIQSGGANYLIPSDAQIEAEEDLRYGGLNYRDLLEAMKRAGTRLNIVILDACRDNPLPKRTRSSARGLTVTAAPVGIRGTAIVYSAAPGQTAQDGPQGGHGVFTGALLRVLDRPGLSLEQVFKETAVRVARATNNRQKPWINSSVTGDFVFNRSAPPGTAAAPSASGTDREALFWSTIKESKRASDFEAYLQQYPNGTFAVLARSRALEFKPRQTAALSRPVEPEFRLEPIEGTYVALRNANVRAAPDVDAPRVATLPKGSKVHVAGKVTAKDWLAVDRGGKRLGYVYSKLLRDAEARVAAVIRPKVTVPKATKDAVGVNMSPGHVFRDCADCPELVVIPPGRFRMGVKSGHGYDFEEPIHEVHIDYSFAVGRFEVTQAEWRAVMGNSVSYYKGDRLPVEQVTWNEAKMFVDRLSAKSGQIYRLLSEAEWEYVARAGTTSRYIWGNEFLATKVAVGEQTETVGSYVPNAFGLYDMHGNVSEWTEDCWNPHYVGAPNDGSAWTIGECEYHIVRGSNYFSKANDQYVAHRRLGVAFNRSQQEGLRVARTLSP
jgi:formylglycine-generating enzyme required for sulfatase activity/uncharacterized caspase-like protein